MGENTTTGFQLGAGLADGLTYLQEDMDSRVLESSASIPGECREGGGMGDTEPER